MNTYSNNQNFNSIPNFNNGRKINIDQKIFLWGLLQENSQFPTSALLFKVEQEYGKISITIRHINRLRASWGLSRDKGRPGHSDSPEDSCCQKDLVRVEPNLPFIGVSIFDDWLEQDDIFSGVVILVKNAIEQYCLNRPDDSFPLLKHRNKTIEMRFKALFYAPLMGIGKLTEFDVTEHCLENIIGRNYQSSTLNQFLGQLERIDAAEFLMPALVSNVPEGEVAYIDGHMIPFWSKAVPMHKGKITMLGRIMPGSNAVVTHNEDGNAVYFDYYAPDIRLTQVIVDYCENLVKMTGIIIFIIDREVNSVEIAREFERRNWGLLSMLDSNQYNDLSDWDTRLEGWLDDGSKIYSGKWKKVRQDDPRTFVIVEKDGNLLPFWGTSELCKKFPFCRWPDLYTRRTELQENGFKRMKEHGALNVNFGTKKIMGPDRHQERKIKAAEDNLKAATIRKEKKAEDFRKQEEKVRESEEKGHGKRLEQRKNNLTIIHNDLKELKKKEEKAKDRKKDIGEPKERADRDTTKQKNMTFRTLLLENALMAFFMALLENLDIKFGMETLISLLFKRSGTCIETHNEIIYRISSKGLSVPYREALEKIVEGINDMNIIRKGKTIQVELKESPT